MNVPLLWRRAIAMSSRCRTSRSPHNGASSVTSRGLAHRHNSPAFAMSEEIGQHRCKSTTLKEALRAGASMLSRRTPAPGCTMMTKTEPGAVGRGALLRHTYYPPVRARGSALGPLEGEKPLQTVEGMGKCIMETSSRRVANGDCL